MAFQGKTEVVVGGSGTIGSGIVRTLLKHGATVLAPVRGAKGKASLEEDVAGLSSGKLQVLEADVATEGGAKQLADAVAAQFGTIDYAVSAIGGWWQNGPLLEQPVSVISEGVHTYAVAHFVFAKAILPLLKDSPASAYFIISGAGGERVTMPGTGLMTVGAAALFGISTVLRAETSEKAYRVNEVRLSAFTKRDSEASKSGGQPFSHRAFGEVVAKALQDTSKKGELIRVDAEHLEGVTTD